MIDRIINDTGQVAVKYYQQIPKRVVVGEVLYIFSIRGQISMAWIAPEHLDRVLSAVGGCCGNKKPGVFRLANESDVRRWTNNGGR
jgi:hypothetical protein